MNRAARIYRTYYDLTPRIVYGGSIEASARNAKIDSRTASRYSIDPGEDEERLYSSVDEYIFDAAERVARLVRSVEEALDVHVTASQPVERAFELPARGLEQRQRALVRRLALVAGAEDVDRVGHVAALPRYRCQSS